MSGDVVTFEDMSEILVAYLEYEQQIRIANEDGGDSVLARSRELVDSATQMMVADNFYDGKPWIDLPLLELKKGPETIAGVDVGGLPPPIVTLTSAVSRPPARPPPLWLPQLAG